MKTKTKTGSQKSEARSQKRLVRTAAKAAFEAGARAAELDNPKSLVGRVSQRDKAIVRRAFPGSVAAKLASLPDRSPAIVIDKAPAKAAYENYVKQFHLSHWPKWEKLITPTRVRWMKVAQKAIEAHKDNLCFNGCGRVRRGGRRQGSGLCEVCWLGDY